MKSELGELHWLDEHQRLSLMELAELSGLSELEIRELTEYGVFVPAESPLTYTTHCVMVARTASRLRDDFELDTTGLALALTLLERLRETEARIRELEAQLPGGIGAI